MPYDINNQHVQFVNYVLKNNWAPPSLNDVYENTRTRTSREWLHSISTRQTALKMEEDRLITPIPVHPMAYAYEPRCNYLPAVVPDDVVVSEDTNIVDSSDRLNNTEWCTCDNCTAMPTETESICCKEADLHDLGVGGPPK